jgi:hypothetical protein
MTTTINASTSAGLVQTADTSGVLALQTAGTTAVTVDASQNVGIGTASPGYRLDVSATSFIAASVSTSYSGAGNIRIADASTTSASAPYIGSAGNNLTFGRIGTAEYARIDSSGNVGIGTASPAFKLDVANSSASGTGAVTTVKLNHPGTTAGDGPRLLFTSGTSTTGGCAIAGSGVALNSADMLFYAGGNTERMRIDSSGNVILNLTSVTNTNGYGGLNLYAPSNAQFQIYMLKQSQIECHIGFKSGSDNNFYVGTGGGGNGVGTYGLYQQNLTNSWAAVSDLRFKTELEPITNALEKVSNVRTVTGRFIHDEENGATRRLPFLIAQDFVDALPEAVDQKDPDKLGLSYSDTVVLAFAAIKELKALVDTQASTITQLQADVAALKGATP